MSELEAKFFVRAFTRFLNAQIRDGRFNEDTIESLVVANQCLETAYGLQPTDPEQLAELAAAGSDGAGAGGAGGAGAGAEQLDEAHPLAHIDLFELFVAGAGGAVDAGRKAEADAVKNEGNGLMKEEKFHEAIKAYTRAIALDATNPVFYCNRAAAHSRLSDYQAAADDCRMALRYDPNYSKAYGRLGIAYSKLERHQLALEAYQTAIRLDPDNADYQNNMAVTQQRIAEGAAAAPGGGAPGAAGAAAGAAGAGGGAPRAAGGLPDLGGIDLMAALSNPQMMSMAQQMMTNPAMADIMQSLQSGGGMDTLMDAGRQMASRMSSQNPEVFAHLHDAFRGYGPGGAGGAGGAAPQDPGQQPPPNGPQ